MTGHKIYTRVLNLLGYINHDNSITPDAELQGRALHALNQILIDLKQEEVADMDCEINLSQSSIEALIYGVAMILSLSGCDAEINRVFTQIYNSKRSTALSEICVVTDVLPTVIEGEN